MDLARALALALALAAAAGGAAPAPHAPAHAAVGVVEPLSHVVVDVGPGLSPALTDDALHSNSHAGFDYLRLPSARAVCG